MTSTSPNEKIQPVSCTHIWDTKNDTYLILIGLMLSSIASGITLCQSEVSQNQLQTYYI